MGNIATFASELTPPGSTTFNVAYVGGSATDSELEVVVTINEQFQHQWGQAGIIVRATANGQNQNPDAYACLLEHAPDQSRNSIRVERFNATNLQLLNRVDLNEDVRQTPITL